GWSKLPRRYRCRKVPWRDQGDSAERFSNCVAENLLTFGRYVVTELTRAFATEVTKDIDRPRNFTDCFGQGLSFFASHLFAELRQLLSQQICSLKKILTSFRSRRRSPLLLRRRCGCTCFRNVCFIRRLKRSDNLVDIRRIDIRKR